MEIETDRLHAELEPGTTLLGGRYTIERNLAYGGAATVYAARAPSGRLVALKILDAKYLHKGRLAERMHNEVRIGAGLHEVPNIVRPIDYGELPELGSRPFIAFELEDAHDLGLRLALERPSQVRACKIARALADTLSHLHARGVVHRDIKPSNVIVDDREGLRVRLIDLGHASSLGLGALPDTRGLTHERELTGTIEYMAPEHILGYPAAPSFDIYGLASALWEMLVGFPPYGRCRSVDLIRRKCDLGIPSPSLLTKHLGATVDAELQALIELGLKKDPNERIPSANAFRDELDKIIARLEGGGDILVFPRGRQVTEKSDVAPRESRPVTEVTTAAQADLAETNPRRETQSSVAAEQPGEPRTGEPRRSATAQTVMLGVLILLGTAWALSETASRCQDAPVHAASLAGLPKAKLEMLTKRERSIPIAPRFVGTPLPVLPVLSRKPEHGIQQPRRPKPPADRVSASSCSGAQKDAQKARAQRDWAAVLELTKKHPDCWSAARKSQLRVHALHLLHRYGECIAEGEHSSNDIVLRTLSYCRAAQE